MKLLEVLPLLEARKNPEQNPQLSAYKQLLKYKDNPNVYISMTDLPKLGLNPMSRWNTPLAIYCYPLKEVWNKYKIDSLHTLAKLPYVGNAPYIQVLEWNYRGRFLDVADYTETDLKKDIRELGNIYDDSSDFNNIVNQASEEHKNGIPAQIFFKICTSICGRDKGVYSKPIWDDRTKKLTKSEEEDEDTYYQKFEYANYSKGGRKWNSLLRKLGYAGFSDKTGLGIIHPNEPIQAFFISMEYVKQLEQIENKNYTDRAPSRLPKTPSRYPSRFPMVLGGNATNIVINGNQEIIIAPERTRKNYMTYTQAVEYCRNLKIGNHGGWRLPTNDELLSLARDYHLSDIFYLYDIYWSSDANNDKLVGVQFHDGGIIRHFEPDNKIKVLAIKTRTIK